MNVTIQTVADKAGVSASTVSRVLRGRGNISAETRQRVLQVAEEVGYTPRKYERKEPFLHARKVSVLSSRKHDLLNNAFYSQIVSGIENVLSKQHIQLVYKTFTGNDTDDLATIESLIRTQDGVILVGYEVDPSLIARISRHELPFVLVDNDSLHMNINCIVNDNQPAAVRIVRHLIDLGHEHIAFIGGPTGHASLNERYNGYIQALNEAGITIHSDMVTLCAPLFRVDDGYRAAHDMLNKARHRPTAIFAANDGLAIGAMRAVHALGLRVPDDVSVVGFDDIESARLVTPALTTVRVYKQEMGVEAGKRLIQMIRGETTTPLKIVLPTEVVHRQSTASPQIKLSAATLS